MSIFSKLFGSSNKPSKQEVVEESKYIQNETNLTIDEEFSHNFMRNGGKFLYCDTYEEIKFQFENILEENDWFEKEVLCYDPLLFNLLEENKLVYKQIEKPSFFFSSCENLIAKEGAVLFSSKQIKQSKPHELPTNIVVFAKTSQLLALKSDVLMAIRKKYQSDYPNNITSINYFEKAKEEDFTQYGHSAKNLYLLLLEDL